MHGSGFGQVFLSETMKSLDPLSPFTPCLFGKPLISVLLGHMLNLDLMISQSGLPDRSRLSSLVLCHI